MAASLAHRRTARGRVTALLAVLTVAGALVTGAPDRAAAAADAVATPRVPAIDLPGPAGASRAEAEKTLLRYWTPERIKEAVANGDRRAAPAKSGGPAAAQALAPVEGPVLEPVGKVLFTYGSGSPGSCTGTLVNTPSGRLVVTAGHCIEEGGPEGEWHRNIAFVPGCGGPEELGVFTAANVAADGLWASDADERYDVGLVQLNDNAAGEFAADVAGAFDIRTTPSTTTDVHSVGYPAAGGYDGNHQEHCEDITEPTDPVEEVGDIYGVNGIFDGRFVATPKFTNRTLQHVAWMEMAASQA